jgi:competence protein ComEC
VPHFLKGGNTVRKLMWFTLGFAGAAAIGAYLGGGITWVATVAGVVLLVVMLLLCRKWKILRPGVVLALGLLVGSLGFWCYEALYLRSAAMADGKEYVLTAEAVDYGYDTAYGSAVESKIVVDGRPYRAVVYINEKLDLIPGDHISGVFRLRDTNGGTEEPTYHRGNGVLLLCYPVEDVSVEQVQQIPDWYYPLVLRHRLLATIDRLFPADTAFFAKALLLGDRSDMPYEVDTAFKVSGISHIVAVSGLHVSILFAVIMLLTAKRRFLSAMIGIPVLVLFAAVAGFTPSVTRACIMQIIMLLAAVFNREYDPPTSLSFAALMMIVFNPLVITSASFQLSVGCMAGIFLFSQPISGWISNLPWWSSWSARSFGGALRRWIAGGAGVTVSAMFFTTPLVAYYFGAVSLIGVVTNLLVLGGVSVCFYGIMAVCIVNAFWGWLAGVLAGMVSWIIRYVLAVAKLLCSVPLAAVYTQSIYIVLWLVLCYLLIGVFLLSKKRKPLVLMCSMAFGLCIALMLSWLEPVTDSVRMTVLDVGQGQCIILQSEGKTFLIDCGGEDDEKAADLAAETLLSQGISRIDGVIVTHYDRDHAGGVGYFLSRIAADVVYLPEGPEDNAYLAQILRMSHGSAVFVTEDLLVSWNGGAMKVFAPILSSSDNERGLCVLFEDQNCDILITGDLSSLGEQLLLKEKDIPSVTVLVAGHHGSRKSTGQKLLDQTQPEYVFISVGEDNRYGHPHEDVLQRLIDAGCYVCRTDLNGTILFRR